MRLLDLFCGAGGAAMGYKRAGFEHIVGVDIAPQPNYPFEFVQGDALEYVAQHGAEFDVIHASPPCQKFSTMTRGLWKDRLEAHRNFIGYVRITLHVLDVPCVIENVPGARDLLINPIMLCGTMFGLEASDGAQLRRHRYFECHPHFLLTPTCNHKGKSVAVYGNAGGTSKRDGIKFHLTEDRKLAMGIDWMTGKELSEAIPPAYTEFIGKHIREGIDGKAKDLPPVR